MRVPGVRKIVLTQGFVALVDDEDFERVVEAGSWRVHKRGARRWASHTGAQKDILLHRFILDAQPGQQVDHVNGDGLDNRRANLRWATSAENSANRRKGVGAVSRFKGVGFDGRNPRRPWLACLQVRGVRRWLGSFGTEEEAAQAYDRAARESFGEFARANFDV
jgi:hypothetical protein